MPDLPWLEPIAMVGLLGLCLDIAVLYSEVGTLQSRLSCPDYIDLLHKAKCTSPLLTPLYAPFRLVKFALTLS